MVTEIVIPVNHTTVKSGKILTLALIQQRLYKKEHVNLEAAVDYAKSRLCEDCMKMSNFTGFFDRCGRNVYIIDTNNSSPETLTILEQAMEDDSYVH